MGGGYPPRVRREIDECVDQRSAGTLRHEIPDEAVGIHSVGGAEIRDAKHWLARQPLRRRQHGRVGRLEAGALRGRAAHNRSPCWRARGDVAAWLFLRAALPRSGRREGAYRLTCRMYAPPPITPTVGYMYENLWNLVH